MNKQVYTQGGVTFAVTIRETIGDEHITIEFEPLTVDDEPVEYHFPHGPVYTTLEMNERRRKNARALLDGDPL